MRIQTGGADWPHRHSQEKPMSPKLIQVNYNFTGTRAEFEAANLPFAPVLAELPGQRCSIEFHVLNHDEDLLRDLGGERAALAGAAALPASNTLSL